MCTTLYVGLAICSVVLLAGCAIALRLFDISPAMAALLWVAAAAIIAKEISMVSKKNLELAALSRTWYTLMECGESLIGVGSGLVLCWYFGFGAEGVVYGALVGAMAVVLADSKHIIRRLKGGTFDLALQRRIVSFCAPMAIASFIEYVHVLARPNDGELLSRGA